MSKTIKHEYTNNGKKHKNIYGLCMCKNCKARRKDFKNKINNIKKSFRKWKSNKEAKKGIYTD